MIYCSKSVVLSDYVVLWFTANLKGRTRCVRSDLMEVVKGVPQGSVLGPLEFTLYIKCLNSNTHGFISTKSTTHREQSASEVDWVFLSLYRL